MIKVYARLNGKIACWHVDTECVQTALDTARPEAQGNTVLAVVK